MPEHDNDGPTCFSVMEVSKIHDHKRYDYSGQAESKNEANVMAGDAPAGALGTYPAWAGSPIGFFIFGRSMSGIEILFLRRD
jgi:hypothetical protein